jgi:hypothetical protein
MTGYLSSKLRRDRCPRLACEGIRSAPRAAPCHAPASDHGIAHAVALVGALVLMRHWCASTAARKTTRIACKKNPWSILRAVSQPDFTASREADTARGGPCHPAVSPVSGKHARTVPTSHSQRRRPGRHYRHFLTYSENRASFGRRGDQCAAGTMRRLRRGWPFPSAIAAA